MTNLLEVPEWNGRTMVSRTLVGEGGLKVVLFHFAAGHELAAHRAPGAITIQFLAGVGELFENGEWSAVQVGDFVAMGPGQEHAVRATSSLTMLLTLVR